MLRDLSKDIQREDGSWVRSYTVEGKTIYTKAGRLFECMNCRCDQNGYIVKTKPAYIGCYSTFTDFQDFARWATSQVGYGLEGYELDKDLLSNGGKKYSKETCCFLPSKINSGLVDRKSRRSKYGLGVNLFNGKYVAKITINSKKVWLGSFATEDQAFLAYKAAKEENMRKIAEEYKDVIDERAYSALTEYVIDKH